MRRAVTVICLIPLLWACSGAPTTDAIVVPAGRLEALPPAPGLPGEDDADAAAPTGPLTLPLALALANAHHPRLLAARERVDAVWSDALQAGVAENPELEIEWEELAVGGKFVADSEVTLVVSQLLALSGRLGRARDAGLAEAREAAIAFDLARWEIFAQVVAGAIAVEVARERIALAAASLDIARSFLTQTDALVAAGQVPAIYHDTAEVELASADLALGEAHAEEEAALLRLAEAMGVPLDAWIRSLTFSAMSLQPPPMGRTLDATVSNHPLLTLAQAARASAAANVLLADAEGGVDVAVSAGYRFAGAEDVHSFLIGLGLPLPVWNMNRLGTEAARHRERVADFEFTAQHQELLTAAAVAHRALDRALETQAVYADRLVPAAERSLQAAEQGYQAGEFSAVDLLTSQRTLIDARGAALDARHRALAAAAELMFLAADPTVYDPFNLQ